MERRYAQIELIENGAEKQLGVGTFVVLKNGLFGPVVSLVDPADRAEAPQAYDYDFDILPLNEMPDDEYPAKFEDVVWMTPSQVKVMVTEI